MAMLAVGLVLVLLAVTGGPASGAAGEALGGILETSLPSPEHLAQLLDQRLQLRDGDVVEHSLRRRLTDTVRRVQPELARRLEQQLEHRPAHYILTELLDARSGHLAGLSEAEQDALKGQVLRGLWDLIKEAFKYIMDALKLLVDPIPFGDFDFHFNGNTVKGNLSLKSLLVGHPEKIQVLSYKLHPLKMCFEVAALLPELTLDSVYDVDVTLNLQEEADDAFRIFGAGPANIELNTIKLHTDICVRGSPFGIEVQNMQISIGGDKVDVKNLFGGGAVSDLISGIATDVVPAMVQELQPELMTALMNYINRLIKDLLPWSKITTPTEEVSTKSYYYLV